MPSILVESCPLCFTIPQELRKLLKEYRFFLNSPFTASKETVLSFCKERGFLPAIISSLRSFGKDLKDNLHIHMLTSSAGIDLKRERQILFTGKDPLICPICKKEMKLVEVAFFSSKEEKIVVYEPP